MSKKFQRKKHSEPEISETSSDEEKSAAIKSTRRNPNKSKDAMLAALMHHLAMVLSIIAFTFVLTIIIVLIVIFVNIADLRHSEDPAAAMKSLSNEYEKALSDISEVFNTNEQLAESLLNSSSCVDLLRKNPSSTSGYYLSRSENGQLTSMYCDMTLSCGGYTGGWMRVAKLDLDQCPTGFQTFFVAGFLRACVKKDEGKGCGKMEFSSSGIMYSKVCGKILGYKYGHLNGPKGFSWKEGITVSSGGKTLIVFLTGVDCDCKSLLRSLMGRTICDDTTCDAKTDVCNGRLLFSNNLCGRSTPYFYKALTARSSSNLEVEVCRDEGRQEEEIPISVLELYVR